MEDDTLAAPETTPGFGGMETMPGDARPSGTPPPKESPKIGRFDVLRVLGQGGMGRVYTAYDEQLDRRVAVKVLRRDVGEQSRRRVEREAQAMAKLTHPNVVQVYEVGEDAGELFIAMEFVQGVPLDEWQRQEGRGWREILDAYRQAGEGLAAAHAVGMVHRDFKPQNAIVETGEDGNIRVRVLDFGLARRAGELATVAEQARDDAATKESTGSLDVKLTATGSLLGTPAYMAPEQFESSDVDAAADQFGFCVALWEGVYGERPFQGDTLPSLIHAVTKGELRDPPKNSAVPAWLRDALRRGLSVKPADRWPSMRELLAVLSRDPIARRNKWVAAIVAIGLVAGAGALGQRQLGGTEELCPDETLGSAWDENARERIEAAFAATEVPFAGQAFDTVSTALDGYAERWATMSKEACEATKVRGEQPADVMHLRMACLQHARTSVDAMTVALETADADVVARVDALVDALDDLDRCDDVDALQHDVPPPPAQHAETVKRARDLLSHARAQEAAFRYAQSSQTTQEALDLIENVPYAPIHAEVALQRAYVLQALGDSHGALESYRSAMRHASESGQDDILHQALVRGMYLEGYEFGHPDEALALQEILLGLGDALGDEAKAWSFSTMGALLDAKDELDASIEWHRKALELWILVDGEDGDGAWMARNQLSHALAKAGKHVEAINLVRQSAILRAKRLGSDHPSVATARIRVGSTLMVAEEYAKAEAEFRGAIQLISRVLGPDHTAVGRWRNDLADALLAQGKLDEAEEQYQLALDAQIGVYGTVHPNVERSRRGLREVKASRNREPAPADPE